MKMREKMKIMLTVLTLAIGGMAACASDATAEAARAEAPEAKATSTIAEGEPKAEGAALAFDAPPAVGTKARCPVMGGEFTVSEGTERSEYKGKHYAFCCPGCKPSFDEDPEKFLKKSK